LNSLTHSVFFQFQADHTTLGVMLTPAYRHIGWTLLC
jgi:hypothetical protein